MKKLFTALMMVFLCLSLVACGPKEQGKTGSENQGQENTGGQTDGKVGAHDLYLITDLGTIDDKSFNQGAYEGLKLFAEENGSEAHYIRPTEQSKASYLASMEQGISAGAKVIVTPGFLFSPAVWEAQDTYPETKFIFVDGVPSEDGKGKNEKVAENTVSVLFKEEQSGYLAGQAAVREGFTKLGFMGGIAVPAVVNFGYGFLKGVNDAAEELGVKVDVRYTYLNSFNPSPDFQTQAASWYNNGVEVIFACAGGAGSSIMSAAEDAGKWVIGVDVDQKDESPRVLTSAMKNLVKAVHDVTADLYADKFQGGKIIRLGAQDQMIQLSSDFSRFTKFTKEDYDKIYQRLESNENGILDSIPNFENTKALEDLKFPNVTLEIVQN